MNRAERQALKWEIRQTYQARERTPLRELIESLPRRYRDLLEDKYLRRLKWDEMQDRHYYSEGQMRNILNAALEELRRRLDAAEKQSENGG